MTEPADRVSPGAALDRMKLLAARFRAADDRPYLATALFSMTVVASYEVPTMAVDRHWRCYVSPDFVTRLPVEQLAAVWVHEVAHLLRDHHGRADLLGASQRYDPHRVNVAQDCEINDDLLAERMSLPEGRVDPVAMGLPPGLLFEQYLPMLPPSGHSVNCGSGAHGQGQPWDLGGTADAAVQPVEADAIRRQTAQAIRSHRRSRGTVPAGWQRWAERILEPTVDWRQVLTGLVREAAAWASGSVDYSYHRPSRRAASMRGVVLPSLRQPLPRVAVVVDTSGSMGDGALAAVLGEVTGVLRAVGIRGNRVTVIACDADVHATRRVTSVQDVVLAGGGGTDLRVGIDSALSVAEPPHFVVVLTDGLTPWPASPLQRTRVIAGLVGADAPQPPDWIAVVRIPLT
ncbi:vWA domain-containing protein [Micromonospora sp. NPDC003197]